MSTTSVKIKRLDPEAILPTRAHPLDAGLDLYALETSDCPIDKVGKVRTGIAVQIPKGYVGIIRDRSSVSQRGLKITAGIIDAGYTGDITACFLNMSGKYNGFFKGDKVAQLLIIPVLLPEIEVVETLDPMEVSERGEKGFGSSGK